MGSEYWLAVFALAPVPSWQLRQRPLCGATLFRMFLFCPVCERWQVAQESVVVVYEPWGLS